MHDAQLLFPHHGVNTGDIFAQATNFVEALGLSHFELELQPEELIVQLALLVHQFSVGQISKFLCIHIFLFADSFPLSALSLSPLASSLYPLAHPASPS